MGRNPSKVTRYQVRKRQGVWEVLILRAGSTMWVMLRQFKDWQLAMWLATGDKRHAVPNYALREDRELVWQPTLVPQPS
jgi:hypothetical protein